MSKRQRPSSLNYENEPPARREFYQADSHVHLQKRAEEERPRLSIITDTNALREGPYIDPRHAERVRRVDAYPPHTNAELFFLHHKSAAVPVDRATYATRATRTLDAVRPANLSGPQAPPPAPGPGPDSQMHRSAPRSERTIPITIHVPESLYQQYLQQQQQRAMQSRWSSDARYDMTMPPAPASFYIHAPRSLNFHETQDVTRPYHPATQSQQPQYPPGVRHIPSRAQALVPSLPMQRSTTDARQMTNPTVRSHTRRPAQDVRSQYGAGIPRSAAQERAVRNTFDRHIPHDDPGYHYADESLPRHTHHAVSASESHRAATSRYSPSDRFLPADRRPSGAPSSSISLDSGIEELPQLVRANPAARARETIDLTGDDAPTAEKGQHTKNAKPTAPAPAKRAKPAEPRNLSRDDASSSKAASQITLPDESKERKILPMLDAKGKGKEGPDDGKLLVQDGFACPYPNPYDPRLRCNAFFSARSVLDRHLGAHLKEEAAMLKRGGEAFDRSSLVFGGLDAPMFACEHCGAAYLRHDALLRHQHRLNPSSGKVACPVLSGMQPKDFVGMPRYATLLDGRRRYAVDDLAGAIMGQNEDKESAEPLGHSEDRHGSEESHGASMDESAHEAHSVISHPGMNAEPKTRYSWPGLQWVDTRGGCEVTAEVRPQPSKYGELGDLQNKTRKMQIVRVREVRSTYGEKWYALDKGNGDRWIRWMRVGEDLKLVPEKLTSGRWPNPPKPSES
ncbi:hypothetical protein CALVIDRAFT_29933 [Calocera viscosa TUFC12733]|uniref:C2H2-type domain-containing protein n=1 Tax=Calocera viscosa (strain TUFC12733) TaxID=1330018 RepID=A0A167PBL2_CALVF|nr:hypothetical protein CALVIDRAFT_29933 [Calocera viscosa TUFC12733]